MEVEKSISNSGFKINKSQSQVFKRDIGLKYLNPRDVLDRKKKILSTKFTFLAKHCKLRENGRANVLIERLQSWIEDFVLRIDNEKVAKIYRQLNK
jgi:hypothetical protein